MKQHFFLFLFLTAFNCLLAQSNVAITVTDVNSGLPIQGAEISLGSTILQTDISGQVLFTDLANGSYSYTIFKTCYSAVNDQVFIDNSNVSINQTLSPQEANSIYVSMSNFGFNPSGFNVNLSNGSGFSQTITSGNPLGDMFENIPFGTYTYTIAKDCFQTATGEVTVDCNGSQSNVISSIPVAVSTNSIYVSMSNFGFNPSGFSVNLSNGSGFSQTITSGNPLGDMFENIPFGTYTYTIAKDCFQTATGEVTVDCNGGQSKVISSIPVAITTNSVFFFLSNFGFNPEGFSINLTDGGSYNQTIASGNPLSDIIESVPFGTYTYTISKDCHETITGQVTVNCNNGDGNIVSEIPVEIILDNTITQAENILTANAIGATYQWLDCNNNNQPIENQTNQVFTATENGSYAVEISNGNCVIVSNCVTVSNLSVENIQKSVTMKVYPNPVNDNVNIKFDKNFETLSLEIISITGQVVKKSIITQSNLITINISDLAKGIYILKADDNEHITSTRIIKE